MTAKKKEEAKDEVVVVPDQNLGAPPADILGNIIDVNNDPNAAQKLREATG